MSISVLIKVYLVLCILWQYFSLNILRFDRYCKQLQQAIEHLYADFTVWHFLHLLIQGPCIIAIHIHVIVSHIFNSTCASIHSYKLVKDVIVHGPLLQFQFVKNIIGCLDVTKLGTSF